MKILLILTNRKINTFELKSDYEHVTFWQQKWRAISSNVKKIKFFLPPYFKSGNQNQQELRSGPKASPQKRTKFSGATGTGPFKTKSFCECSSVVVSILPSPY